MGQKLFHNISQKKKFPCLKMHYFRAISPKWILDPQKEISCHIFKKAILTKFFDDLMNHITREYAGKKKKLFLNVSSLTIVNLLLWPFKVSSLYFTCLYMIDKLNSYHNKTVILLLTEQHSFDSTSPQQHNISLNWAKKIVNSCITTLYYIPKNRPWESLI